MLCPGSRYRVLGLARHPGYRVCVRPSRSRARNGSPCAGGARRRRYRALLPHSCRYRRARTPGPGLRDEESAPVPSPGPASPGDREWASARPRGWWPGRRPAERRRGRTRLLITVAGQRCPANFDAPAFRLFTWSPGHQIHSPTGAGPGARAATPMPPVPYSPGAPLVSAPTPEDNGSLPFPGCLFGCPAASGYGCGNGGPPGEGRVARQSGQRPVDRHAPSCCEETRRRNKKGRRSFRAGGIRDRVRHIFSKNR
jgi:hypothetical protein